MLKSYEKLDRQYDSTQSNGGLKTLGNLMALEAVSIILITRWNE